MSTKAKHLKTKAWHDVNVDEILRTSHPYKHKAGSYHRYRAVFKFPDGVNGSKFLDSEKLKELTSQGVQVRNVEVTVSDKPRKPRKTKKVAKKASTPKKLFGNLPFDLSAPAAVKKPRKKAAAAGGAKPKRVRALKNADCATFAEAYQDRCEENGGGKYCADLYDSKFALCTSKGGAVRKGKALKVTIRKSRPRRHTVLNEDQTMRRELLKLRKIDRTEYCDTFADIYGDRCVSKYGSSSARCPNLRQKKLEACRSGKKVRLGRAPQIKYGPKNKPAPRKPRAKKSAK